MAVEAVIEPSVREETEQTPGYQRAVVLYNPTKEGTPQFEQTRRRIEHLSKAFNDLPVEYFSTDPDRLKTQEAMLKMLGAKDLLIVIGGDGTVNTAVRILVHQDKEKRAALLVAPAGTANDFSHNRNGDLEGDDALTKIMQSGSTIEMSPMRIEVTTPDAVTEERIAVNNAGFNYDAKIAAEYNKPEHRNSRLRRIPAVGPLIQDVRTITKSFGNLTTVPVNFQGDKETSNVSNVTLVHAKRAAKKLKYDSSHTAPEFRFIPNREVSVYSALKSAIKMLRGKYNGEARKQVIFQTAEEPILGHVDGETFTVPPTSTVNVELSDQKIKVHSTKTN